MSNFQQQQKDSFLFASPFDPHNNNNNNNPFVPSKPLPPTPSTSSPSSLPLPIPFPHSDPIPSFPPSICSPRLKGAPLPSPSHGRRAPAPPPPPTSYQRMPSSRSRPPSSRGTPSLKEKFPSIIPSAKDVDAYCHVCLEPESGDERRLLLLNCGHVCLCRPCFDTGSKEITAFQCPQCSKRITSIRLWPRPSDFEDTCLVCYDADPNMLLGCGHVSWCSSCFQQMKRIDRSKCVCLRCAVAALEIPSFSSSARAGRKGVMEIHLSSPPKETSWPSPPAPTPAFSFAKWPIAPSPPTASSAPTHPFTPPPPPPPTKSRDMVDQPSSSSRGKTHPPSFLNPFSNPIPPEQEESSFSAIWKQTLEHSSTRKGHSRPSSSGAAPCSSAASSSANPVCFFRGQDLPPSSLWPASHASAPSTSSYDAPAVPDLFEQEVPVSVKGKKCMDIQQPSSTTTTSTDRAQSQPSSDSTSAPPSSSSCEGPQSHPALHRSSQFGEELFVRTRGVGVGEQEMQYSERSDRVIPAGQMQKHGGCRSHKQRASRREERTKGPVRSVWKQRNRR